MKQSYGRWAASSAVLALGLMAFGAWNDAPTRAQDPAAPAAVQKTGNWVIDPMHTNVNFAIRHLGISTVRGRFDDVSGTIYANAEDPSKSSVQVTIKTASVNTAIAMRDDHLRTADFFDVEKYPEITFKSTRVTKARNGFVARGDLTMHGVTRTVDLPFTVSGPIADQEAGSRFGAETSIRLNRLDYGISDSQKLPNGSWALGRDVDVVISLEAIPAKPAAK